MPKKKAWHRLTFRPATRVRRLKLVKPCRHLPRDAARYDTPFSGMVNISSYATRLVIPRNLLKAQMAAGIYLGV